MQSVALHLQKHAVTNDNDTDRDLFARSSFNRYYYSMFLEIRSFLSDIDPKWSQLAHKSYPEILSGQVKSLIKKSRRQLEATGDRTNTTLFEKANKAAIELSELTKTAYAIRVIADYEPATPVVFSEKNRFSLANISITDAHGWTPRARSMIQQIRNAIT